MGGRGGGGVGRGRERVRAAAAVGSRHERGGVHAETHARKRDTGGCVQGFGGGRDSQGKAQGGGEEGAEEGAESQAELRLVQGASGGAR